MASRDRRCKLGLANVEVDRQRGQGGEAISEYIQTKVLASRYLFQPDHKVIDIKAFNAALVQRSERGAAYVYLTVKIGRYGPSLDVGSWHGADVEHAVVGKSTIPLSEKAEPPL